MNHETSLRKIDKPVFPIHSISVKNHLHLHLHLDHERLIDVSGKVVKDILS